MKKSTWPAFIFLLTIFAMLECICNIFYLHSYAGMLKIITLAALEAVPFLIITVYKQLGANILAKITAVIAIIIVLIFSISNIPVAILRVAGQVLNVYVEENT